MQDKVIDVRPIDLYLKRTMKESLAVSVSLSDQCNERVAQTCSLKSLKEANFTPGRLFFRVSGTANVEK